MSWLVRMEVSTETAWREGISDSYAWHKKIWECFPERTYRKRVELGFLHRIDILDGSFRIWLLSKEKPSPPPWCHIDNFAINKIGPSFLARRFYSFDLLANPVKTIVQRGPNGETLFRANGKRKHGKRVPLVKPDELHAWLTRKGLMRCMDQITGQDIPGGFRILEEKPLEIRPMLANHFRKRGENKNNIHSAYHGGVQFRGTLEVTNTEQFMETYYSGIGSAKGFGFGLMLLVPINL
ncbi:MAG: type I-E CRISPR-associated protein Cas6/Cse3/CasE [Desulfobulbaceae bacterium]|nr:type I-E CRISPR-associated protein Cas6/Cse3/CasE [Desulfobulbaceae bacterium]